MQCKCSIKDCNTVLLFSFLFICFFSVQRQREREWRLTDEENSLIHWFKMIRTEPCQLSGANILTRSPMWMAKAQAPASWVFTYLMFFFSLIEKTEMRERQRQAREILYPLVLSPNVHDGQGWAKLKLADTNSIRFSYMGSKDPSTWAIICGPIFKGFYFHLFGGREGERERIIHPLCHPLHEVNRYCWDTL